MEDIINKAVVFDYFSGRVTPLQKKSVENWLSEQANRELYYLWLHEWELNSLQTNANWQVVYEKTTQRINDTSFVGAEQKLPPTTWTISRPAGWVSRSRRLAASLLVVVLACGWLYRDGLLYRTVRTGFGETRSLLLPDGSSVALNANSVLRFPRFGFGEWTLATDPAHENPRLVELSGEADFSVRHLANHQRFVVRTARGLTVTVLGTQFTVFSRERATRVALRSGRVQLTTRQRNTPLIMQPGDLVTLNRQGKLALTRTAHPETMAAWKNHRFDFDQTSLQELADLLHENYGLTVTISESQLASRTISGSFTAQNANELLKLIAQLLQINYIREDNRVLFTN